MTVVKLKAVDNPMPTPKRFHFHHWSAWRDVDYPITTRGLSHIYLVQRITQERRCIHCNKVQTRT